MRSKIKYIALPLLASNLSACAVTKDIVQNAYDTEAEKNCQTQYGEAGSIHKTAKSNCVNGIYAKDAKWKSKTKKKSWEEKSE